MLDPATITMLATSAVSFLTSLLDSALEKGAEEAGKSTIAAIFDKIKRRLGHQGSQEALADLAKAPSDADAQATLRTELKEALAADQDLATFLQKWLVESKAQAESAGIRQTGNTVGDHNTTVQIVGSGNSTTLR